MTVISVTPHPPTHVTEMTDRYSVMKISSGLKLLNCGNVNAWLPIRACLDVLLLNII